MRRGFALALLIAAAGSAPASGQLTVRGYGLGVGMRASAGAFAPAGTSLVGRVRLMPTFATGPLELEAAYEHVATRVPPGGSFSITSAGGTGKPPDWLGTDWTIHSTSRSEWRHRFDRLAVSLQEGDVEMTVGRQAISWATTLFLTPADPFSPFDPSDPFREYRAGVDAVRVRVSRGPFTEVEGVVRPTETASGTTWTALGRAQTDAGGWSVGAWGGMLHGRPGEAVFATGALGSTAVRAELSVRHPETGGATLRGALGVDRFFRPGDRDLYVVVEIQHDGFGADAPSKLLNVGTSKPFQRNEMQTLGDWTAAVRASYQLHPLVSVDALSLMNLRDQSVLLAPGLSWSATSAASVRLGAFTGIGQELGPGFFPVPGSEYGFFPTLAYLSMSWFW